MIYASIDLGSDLIKIVVCEYIDSKYNILASTYTRTVGIKKGIIVDSVMVQKSLMLALDEIEKQLGFRLDKAIVSIPCFDAKVNMYESEVVIPNKVTGSDIISCFEKAIKENISSKEEVLSVFPIDYVVNGDTHLLDPKGMEAYKLGCRELITTLPKELVYSYLEVFKNCKIDVIDLCISTLGDFYQFRRDEYNDLMGAIINIGNSKSEFGIFNKGMLVKNSIIPIGSNKVNHDIKYV